MRNIDSRPFMLRRRRFVKWCTAACFAILSVPVLEKTGKAALSRLDERFLIVDGWVLPSFYFE